MKTFAEIYESMKETLAYQVEELSLAFTESILLRMEQLDDMPGKVLAERMGFSEAYVSKLLKGKNNFTLETLVKLARALECRIEAPQLVPIQAEEAPGQVVLPFERLPKSMNTFMPRAVPPPQMTSVHQNDDDKSYFAAA
jgi:transcriptional regulator with XRE-family HTH domain